LSWLEDATQYTVYAVHSPETKKRFLHRASSDGHDGHAEENTIPGTKKESSTSASSDGPRSPRT